jgi:hypothetical protein
LFSLLLSQEGTDPSAGAEEDGEDEEEEDEELEEELDDEEGEEGDDDDDDYDDEEEEDEEVTERIEMQEGDGDGTGNLGASLMDICGDAEPFTAPALHPPPASSVTALHSSKSMPTLKDLPRRRNSLDPPGIGSACGPSGSGDLSTRRGVGVLPPPGRVRRRHSMSGPALYR